MKLEDGTGSGRMAKVDEENRLTVFSISEPEDKNINRGGKVWSITFDVTPTGANDYFFYLTNTGSSELSITDIRVSSSVATRLNYNIVNGTPAYTDNAGAGNVATPINRNRASALIPSATIVYDTDITGLTSLGTVFFEQCPVVNTRYKLSTTSTIILSKGSAIAFQRVAATGTITMTVSLVDLES